jgi:pyroglutamyl-peptidase
MAAEPTILVTGFEPFGGDDLNPSALVARELSGRRIAGAMVASRILPVDLDGLGAALDAALASLPAPPPPLAVVALGLAASEAVIRLERVALNVADFSIPDNAGALPRNRPLEPGGPDGRLSRLPLEAILGALLARGIPARLSETAGLYLCNAAMYRLLGRLPPGLPCGFVHLPPLPAQVARRIARSGGRVSGRDPGLASMPLELQAEAIAVVVETTLAGGGAAA